MCHYMTKRCHMRCKAVSIAPGQSERVTNERCKCWHESGPQGRMCSRSTHSIINQSEGYCYGQLMLTTSSVNSIKQSRNLYNGVFRQGPRSFGRYLGIRRSNLIYMPPPIERRKSLSFQEILLLVASTRQHIKLLRVSEGTCPDCRKQVQSDPEGVLEIAATPAWQRRLVVRQAIALPGPCRVQQQQPLRKAR